MIKANNRPVNLRLHTFRFPPMALVSIAHRITGLLLFLLIPWCLYLLSCALASAVHFSTLLLLMQRPWAQLIDWVLLAAVWFHVIAGFRHLLMDIGLGESLNAARTTAYVVMVVWFVVVILTGVWIW